MIKYIDDFRQEIPAKKIAKRINEIAPNHRIQIMEVCGGHTNAIFRFGIRGLLPESIKLLSGPGCPVCVTPNRTIDTAIELSNRDDVIITTFGDMIRVPGSYTSLLAQRAKGRDIRICLSPMDALAIAKENPLKKVVFIGVGFETTAPCIAVSVQTARLQNISNYFLLCALKTMPHALAALLESDDVRIDGFICPGHVSAITGLSMYESLVQKYNIPCVVAGFEPTDILSTIELIVRQIVQHRAAVENQYTRVVKYEGNTKAREILESLFVPCDSSWRGIGTIPQSGYGLSESYREFDILSHIDLDIPEVKETPGCICGNIMRGKHTPLDCKLFAKVCTPEDPQGACMVSAEGTCAAYYKYRD
ncbi:MAG: hydrogenase formation protein HypD [Spirochaetales bacterium]|nr:hydrogenase formation protein HypD [Spirochaetales bacterium]